MRSVFGVLFLALALLPRSAAAQPLPPGMDTTIIPPPITPADMAFYCVYENRIYSLGAGLCVGRTPFTCVPSTGPATGSRAFWSGKEDQVFTRPVCN